MLNLSCPTSHILPFPQKITKQEYSITILILLTSFLQTIKNKRKHMIIKLACHVTMDYNPYFDMSEY